MYWKIEMRKCIFCVLGAIVVAEELDYERAKEYFLTIQATDGGIPPLSNHASVNITVTDANDNAPIFSQAAYSAMIQEDVNEGHQVTQVVATDLDSGINAKVFYRIVGGNTQNHFGIDELNGVVRVAQKLDREMVSHYLQVTRHLIYCI